MSHTCLSRIHHPQQRLDHTAGTFWVRFKKICDKRKKCHSWCYSYMLTLKYSPFSLGHLILHHPFPWATRSILIVVPDYSKPSKAHGSDWSHTTLKQGEGNEGLPKRKGSALHTFFCGGREWLFDEGSQCTSQLVKLPALLRTGKKDFSLLFTAFNKSCHFSETSSGAMTSLQYLRLLWDIIKHKRLFL